MAFAYRAQDPAGTPISGTIAAANHDDAQRKLAVLRLTVTELEAVAAPAKPRPLRGSDLLTFNDQLAHLTQAGLPVERGLRLIAGEMRSRRLAATIHQIAAEAERGRPLAEVLEAHRGHLPALYGRLVDAGVRTGNLPGMLFNLGRHLDLVQRLRAAIWRALAYPLLVLLAFGLVLGFVGLWVLPMYRDIYAEFGRYLPLPTEFVLSLAPWTPLFLGVLAAVVIGVPILWGAIRAAGKDQMVVDALVLPLPLLGPVLKRSMIARWCDAVNLGVSAGLDLPAAIELAGAAVGSPALRADGRKMTDALRSGRRLSDTGRMEVLTASVAAAMDLACDGRDLPTTLTTLTAMYQQQADVRLSVMATLLGPIMLVVLACLIGTTIVALFLPLVSLIQAISGP
jgi:type IV pilus assembly protein PilC